MTSNTLPWRGANHGQQNTQSDHKSSDIPTGADRPGGHPIGDGARFAGIPAADRRLHVSGLPGAGRRPRGGRVRYAVRPLRCSGRRRAGRRAAHEIRRRRTRRLLHRGA